MENLYFLIVIVVSLTATGCTLTRLLVKGELDPLLRFLITLCIGILSHGLFGLVIAIMPAQQFPIAVFFAILNFTSFFKFGLPEAKEQFQNLTKAEKLYIGVTPVFALALLFITALPVNMPQDLYDGPFVFKNHNQHVKIQVLTMNLPADNVIPHVASEFMLQGISFSENRPMLPGQEVVNRTLLLSLVNVYFQSLIYPRELLEGPLGTFSYVGQEWPDVESLSVDQYFMPFLVVAMFLNSLLFLALLLLLKMVSINLSHKTVLLFAVVFLTNAYFLSQVIFTWPKNLAAFFIIVGGILVWKRLNLFLAGIIYGLAYHSHPLALGFAGFIGLYLLYELVFKRISIKQLLTFSIALFLALLPWQIWTNFIVAIPSNLIGQNMFVELNFHNLVWIRLQNLLTFMMPVMLKADHFIPFVFLVNTIICIPGIVGVMLSVQAAAGTFTYIKEHSFFIVWMVILPTLLMWVVFSVSAVPSMHGFQAIFPFLLVFAYKWMSTNHKVLVGFLSLQLLYNLMYLNIYTKMYFM